MSLLDKMMRDYQDSNPEKFNKEFLTVKERDNEEKYFDVLMKTFNYVKGENYSITYLGHEKVGHKIYDPDKTYVSNPKQDKGVKKETYISTDKSLLSVYKFYFELQCNDEKEVINFDLYYPELIKGQYFLINDNRYFPVFQLLDSSFFNKNDGIVFKTLIQPIVILGQSDTFSLKAFKKEINPMYYFFAKFGYYKTLEYFGIQDDIVFTENKTDEYEDVIEFPINKKMYAYIDREAYNKSSNSRKIFNSILNCFNSRSKIDKLDEDDIWAKKLGSFFTSTTDKNKKIAKANNTLMSLERTLDELNKEILRYDPEDKKDIYAVLRYALQNYEDLYKRDNCNLANKRIRSHEVFLYPLFLKSTSFVKRINNGKTINMDRLKNFIPSKGFIIKCAINNELARYDNSCNSISLITKLSFSQGGVQSQFQSGAVSTIYRVNNPSYIGKIDLLATSAGNPGCTGLFTPFVKLIDDKYFTEKEDNSEADI